MSTYTGTLTVTIVPAVGDAAATEIDEAGLIALVEKKISELDYATKGTAMVTVVAVITKN